MSRILFCCYKIISDREREDVRQQQLPPDDVEGDVIMILSYWRRFDDDLRRVRISRARYFKEFGQVEDDGERRREWNQPPGTVAINIILNVPFPPSFFNCRLFQHSR